MVQRKKEEGITFFTLPSDIRIIVSGITRTENSKAVYVLIEDGNKTAEFSIPGLKIIRNNGFDVNEMSELKEFIDGNQDEIFKLAKGINPFRTMMR